MRENGVNPIPEGEGNIMDHCSTIFMSLHSDTTRSAKSLSTIFHQPLVSNSYQVSSHQAQLHSLSQCSPTKPWLHGLALCCLHKDLTSAMLLLKAQSLTKRFSHKAPPSIFHALSLIGLGLASFS